MVVRNKTTGRLYRVQSFGPQVVLISLESGSSRKLSQELAKKGYEVVESMGELDFDGVILGVSEELIESQDRAKEILGESTLKNRVRIPSLVNVGPLKGPIRIDFSEPKETTTKSKKQASKGSVVTLQDICIELNMDPSRARRVLRGKIDKGSGKWEWSDPSEVEKIKSLLK